MKIYFKEGKNTAFWAGVKSGSKTHTCRKRAEKVGASMALVCGGETVNVTCTAVQRFSTEVLPYGVAALVDGRVMAPETAAAFSKRGGFASVADMLEYYGDEFNGYINHWGQDLYEGIH